MSITTLAVSPSVLIFFPLTSWEPVTLSEGDIRRIDSADILLLFLWWEDAVPVLALLEPFKRTRPAFDNVKPKTKIRFSH